MGSIKVITTIVSENRTMDKNIYCETANRSTGFHCSIVLSNNEQWILWDLKIVDAYHDNKRLNALFFDVSTLFRQSGPPYARYNGTPKIIRD